MEWCLATPLALCVLCCYPASEPAPAPAATAGLATPEDQEPLSHELPVFGPLEVHDRSPMTLHDGLSHMLDPCFGGAAVGMACRGQYQHSAASTSISNYLQGADRL